MLCCSLTEQEASKDVLRDTQQGKDSLDVWRDRDVDVLQAQQISPPPGRSKQVCLPARLRACHIR